jgi:uncharacterized protein YggT (Ycf19 family)
LEVFIYVLVSTLSLLIDGILLVMTITAILSWFPAGSDSKFQRVMFAMVEPVLMPMRVLFAHMGWFQGLPIDMSFMATCLVLVLMQFALSFVRIV